MDKFFASIKKRKFCLEVSPGICGAFPFWRQRLPKQTLICIDPLLEKYQDYLEKKGFNWFKDFVCYHEQAETLISELTLKIEPP
jgi:hypothetical protein